MYSCLKKFMSINLQATHEYFLYRLIRAYLRFFIHKTIAFFQITDSEFYSSMRLRLTLL